MVTTNKKFMELVRNKSVKDVTDYLQRTYDTRIYVSQMVLFSIVHHTTLNYFHIYESERVRMLYRMASEKKEDHSIKVELVKPERTFSELLHTMNINVANLGIDVILVCFPYEAVEFHKSLVDKRLRNYTEGMLLCV